MLDLKERFGDWEIDTVIGSNHKGALVTINDRLTSKVWTCKLSEKDAAPLALSVATHKRLDTYDNGIQWKIMLQNIRK